MKWLIILGLIFLAWMFIAVRYRKQIQAAIYVWKMFRQMRQAGKQVSAQPQIKKTSPEVSLVKCSKCGTWLQQNEALNLRSKIFYCSTKCMESAVKVI